MRFKIADLRSCPVVKVVYGRGGFYQSLFVTTRVLKPALADATDATGHDIKRYFCLYYGRLITLNQQPGHGKIKVICLSEISLMPCPYATTD